MTKRIIRSRFICICLVLTMLISCFPAGTAWAALNESKDGDLRVAAETFTYWYYNPNNVSGKWATTLEGWAVVGYNGTYFPLIVHPSRVPVEWVDSGRNDEGREALVEKYRYTGTYWTLENGLLDVNSGSEDPDSDYNLYLDEDTATLHLRDAELKAMYCIILDNNVETIMPDAGTNDLTIELHGENKISAYHESSNISMGISFDPNNQRGDVTSDLILTEGDTTGDNSTEGVSTGESSLTMECGAVGNNPRAESYAIYLEHSDLTVDGIKLDVNVKASEGQYKSRTAIKADNVTIKDGSTVNVTLEEGGTAFDAQSVTIEEGASLTVTMTKNCQLLASSASASTASTLSARSGGGLSIQGDGTLKIVVESGITDLTGVLAAGTDLSQVEFVVNGMLVLPEGSEANALKNHITGSGNVVIRAADSTSGDTMYTISNGSLTIAEGDSLINGDINVSTDGEEITDGERYGYTWTKVKKEIPADDGETGDGTTGDGTTGEGTTGDDQTGGGTGSGEGETGGTSSELETIDVWTLEILRPNVLGDIIITQDLPYLFPGLPYTGGEDDDDTSQLLNINWLDDYVSSHKNEVEIHIIAKSTKDQCNIIGDVEVLYNIRQYNTDSKKVESGCLSNLDTKYFAYLKALGSLTFGEGDGDDDEINVDNITYKYGKVKIAGTLNGAGIQAFKAELLPTADLTLSEGISLTENSDNFQIITGMDLDEDVISQLPVILGILRGDDDWDSNKVSKYEDLLKKQFSAIGENSFIAQDGAQYKTTGASSSPVQVSISVRSIVPLNSDICQAAERPQIIITLEGSNDSEDGDKDQDKDGGEDEEKGGDNPTDSTGTNEPGDTPETPGEDADGEDDVTPIATIDLELTQDDVSKFIVFPDNSSLFPEGSEFIMKKSVQASNPSFATYAFSVKYPAIEGFEEMTHGYSPSSSGDLGYRLPSVNEGTDADGEGETAGENGGYSQPSSCICDTLGPVNVNGSYQFKLTSTDGSTPTVTVSGGSFHVGELVRDGNDYYVKVCAVGGVNTTGDVYVNGTRVATLKALCPYGGVSSDTTAPFTVRQGETYQFRLTSDTMPSMTAGSPSFVVEYAGNIGRDWFFKVRAVGEAGDGCGFYVNGAPFPVAIAHITATES